MTDWVMAGCARPVQIFLKIAAALTVKGKLSKSIFTWLFCLESVEFRTVYSSISFEGK